MAGNQKRENKKKRESSKTRDSGFGPERDEIRERTSDKLCVAGTSQHFGQSFEAKLVFVFTEESLLVKLKSSGNKIYVFSVTTHQHWSRNN